MSTGNESTGQQAFDDLRALGASNADALRGVLRTVATRIRDGRANNDDAGAIEAIVNLTARAAGHAPTSGGTTTEGRGGSGDLALDGARLREEHWLADENELRAIEQRIEATVRRLADNGVTDAPSRLIDIDDEIEGVLDDVAELAMKFADRESREAWAAAEAYRKARDEALAGASRETTAGATGGGNENLSGGAPCVWTVDEDGVYDTTCGNRWYFDTGTAAENGARFCMYCGATLIDSQDPDMRKLRITGMLPQKRVAPINADRRIILDAPRRCLTVHDAERAAGGAKVAAMVGDEANARLLLEKRDRLVKEAHLLDPHHVEQAWHETTLTVPARKGTESSGRATSEGGQ